MSYQLPPEIIFPFEQSIILIFVGMLKVFGEFPIAVTTKSNSRVYSIFETKRTMLLFSIEIALVGGSIEYWYSPQSSFPNVNGAMTKSVVIENVLSVYNRLVFQEPPIIVFPFEQSTIFISVESVFVAGVFPIAVTTKLKFMIAATFVVTRTILSLTIEAPVPTIE